MKNRFLKFKKLIYLLVLSFLLNSPIYGADLSHSHGNLNPDLSLGREDFKQVWTALYLRQAIEQGDNFIDNPSLKGAKEYIASHKDLLRDLDITFTDSDVVIDIPWEGTALRYFSPLSGDIITPFSNVRSLSTREVFKDRLWCQVIRRTKPIEDLRESEKLYKFLRHPEFRKKLEEGMLRIVKESRAQGIKTVFVAGTSAKPVQVFYERSWRKFFPDIPLPGFVFLEHTGQVNAGRFETSAVEEEIKEKVKNLIRRDFIRVMSEFEEDIRKRAKDKEAANIFISGITAKKESALAEIDRIISEKEIKGTDEIRVIRAELEKLADSMETEMKIPGKIGHMDRHFFEQKTKRVKKEITCLSRITSEPMMILDDIAVTGKTLARTKSIIQDIYGQDKTGQIFSCVLICNDVDADSLPDNVDPPSWNIDICGVLIPESKIIRYRGSSWYHLRHWIKGHIKHAETCAELSALYSKTEEQERVVFDEYLPYDFDLLSESALAGFMEEKAPEKFYEDITARGPPSREYVERNKLAVADASENGKNPVVFRIPLEVVQELARTAGEETVKRFFKRFSSMKNIYLELFIMTGTGAIDSGIYGKYDITVKEMPEGFKYTRKNTVTFIPAYKGELLEKFDIQTRIGNFEIEPEDSLLLPIGLRNDSTGFIRDIILGCRIISLARVTTGKMWDDMKLMDTIQADIIEPLKLLYGMEELKRSDIDYLDILTLINGDINGILRALCKLTRLLPAAPLDAEEIRREYDNAENVLIAA
ncbi:MAG: hypothetical protein ABH883_05860 [Candidatus Omnitrophota bacterium]